MGPRPVAVAAGSAAVFCMPVQQSARAANLCDDCASSATIAAASGPCSMPARRCAPAPPLESSRRRRESSAVGSLRSTGCIF